MHCCQPQSRSRGYYFYYGRIAQAGTDSVLYQKLVQQFALHPLLGGSIKVSFSGFRKNLQDIEILPDVTFDEAMGAAHTFEPRCCKNRNIHERLAAMQPFAISIGQGEEAPMIKAIGFVGLRE